jgi:CheY-like chemotaxis protein
MSSTAIRNEIRDFLPFYDIQITFTFEFRCPSEVVPWQAKMTQEVSVGSAAVEVLLVEDEPLVRNLLALTLMKYGYHVVAASSGEDALNLSRKRPEKIDILVTDIEMPGMNGIELYMQIREERPETAVLFISGRVDCFRESLPECPFLKKPFGLQQFVEKVAEVLSTSSS